MEGSEFICPWSQRNIRQGDRYDIDHLMPLSVYPVNELWNLVPSDPYFNSHTKRDRLPTQDRLQKAKPHLELTYQNYSFSKALAQALREDVAIRFMTVKQNGILFPVSVASAVINFIDQVANSRNLARF